MSTVSTNDISPLETADATMEFVLAFDAWMRKTSVASAGESVARLRLLNELHCNGPRKMADLADSLGVTPRNITSLVDGLEADNMVRRTDHPTDRRITLVEITGGSATVETQFSALRDAIARLFTGMSDADRASFVRLVSGVTELVQVPSPGRAAAGRPR